MDFVFNFEQNFIIFCFKSCCVRLVNRQNGPKTIQIKVSATQPVLRQCLQSVSFRFQTFGTSARRLFNPLFCRQR